jgi:hypothetical protein
MIASQPVPQVPGHPGQHHPDGWALAEIEKLSGAACAMSWQAQVYPAAIIRAVVDEP